jgi:hypothetical protein
MFLLASRGSIRPAAATLELFLVVSHFGGFATLIGIFRAAAPKNRLLLEYYQT